MNHNNFKVLVIGCGSIGRRHLANLIKLRIAEVIVAEKNLKRLKSLKRKFNIQKAYLDYKKAIYENKNIRAAIISTPTSLHIPIAVFLARHKINLFIEKPLSHNLKDVDRLISLIKKHKLIAMVGMCYRFHSGLKIIKKLIQEKTIGRIYSARLWSGHYLPYWHPGEDYRVEYSAKKSLGGGVILTSIHSIDYMRWLFGEVNELICFYDKVSDLDIDVEDVALFVFRFKNNILVQLYLDFLARVNEHRIDIIGQKGHISWNYFKNVVNIFDARIKKWRRIKYRFTTNDMYLSQMQYFVDCLRKEKQIETDCLQGKRDLEVVLAAKESMRRRKIIKILS